MKWAPTHGVQPHNLWQRFEGRGAESTVADGRDAEVILRQPGSRAVRYAGRLVVPLTPAVERVPGAPPRFLGWTAAVAMVFVGLGVVFAIGFPRAAAG